MLKEHIYLIYGVAIIQLVMEGNLKIFFHIEGKFDHALQQFIGRDAFEILAYQFLGKQASDIADFKGFVF